MKKIAPFKRGDTFSLYCVYKEEGLPTSLEEVIIRSQIRTSGIRSVLVDTLVSTKIEDKLGEFSLVPSNPNTSSWPLGEVLMDIEFSDGYKIRSTETFSFTIVEEITRDG